MFLNQYKTPLRFNLVYVCWRGASRRRWRHETWYDECWGYITVLSSCVGQWYNVGVAGRAMSDISCGGVTSGPWTHSVIWTPLDLSSTNRISNLRLIRSININCLAKLTYDDVFVAKMKKGIFDHTLREHIKVYIMSVLTLTFCLFS